MPDEQLAVDDIVEREHVWLHSFKVWGALYWVCGVGAVMSSTLAASSIAGTAQPWVSTAAALFIAFVGFADPQTRSNGYLSAWRDLSTALIRYKAGRCDFDELVMVLAQAEGSISSANKAATIGGAKMKEGAA